MGVYPLWAVQLAGMLCLAGVGAAAVWLILGAAYRELKAENARLTRERDEVRDTVRMVRGQNGRLRSYLRTMGADIQKVGTEGLG